jgi:hypothetical protein
MKRRHPLQPRRRPCLANPSLTITADAERCMDQFLAS